MKTLGILRAGKFLSLAELNLADTDYARVRQQTETALFGAKVDGTPDIVYATLGVKGSNAYGDVAVYLKEDVKERSTVTRRDSLNGLSGFNYSPDMAMIAAQPMPDIDYSLLVEGPNYQEVMAATDIDQVTAFATRDYFEVQIHGGVSIKDIAKISVSRQFLTPELKSMAASNGIPIEIW